MVTHGKRPPPPTRYEGPLDTGPHLGARDLRAMRRWAHGLTRWGQIAAEDAAQDAALSLAQRLAREGEVLPADRDARARFLFVSVLLAVRAARKRAHADRARDERYTPPEPLPSPEEGASHAEERAARLAALASLSEDEREALLRWTAGEGVSRIAPELHRRHSTVQRMIRGALLRVKNLASRTVSHDAQRLAPSDTLPDVTRKKAEAERHERFTLYAPPDLAAALRAAIAREGEELARLGIEPTESAALQRLLRRVLLPESPPSSPKK